MPPIMATTRVKVGIQPIENKEQEQHPEPAKKDPLPGPSA